MPYQKNADLNAPTKKAHPGAHAQTVFRAAFNSAAKNYSETSAFKIAHAAADKSEGKKPMKKHTATRRK